MYTRDQCNLVLGKLRLCSDVSFQSRQFESIDVKNINLQIKKH